MTEQKNIVEFGLEKVHYAPITQNSAGGVQFGTPVAITGSVELSLEPKGELMEFEADNTTYFASQNNQGYTGTLKLALLPDHFRIACLGETLHSTDKTLTELANATSKPFALMFQFRGDKKGVRHVLYYCVANRASIGSKTKGNGEPNTTDLTFRAMPRLDNDVVKRKTTEETPETIYNNWYKNVYNPA